jgi:hypothetical protein
MTIKTILIPVFLLCTACERGGDYRLGVDLTSMEFNYVSESMGVHPNQSVLDDPNNIFSDGLTNETKWDLESNKSNAGMTVPCFYAWSTMLAFQPTGEHQFYTASALHDMYLRQESSADDIYAVRDLALAGYQAVLEHFPSSVSYLSDGITTFELAPMACQAIIDLGETPLGDCPANGSSK